MKVTTGLTLVGIGAILAFAVLRKDASAPVAGEVEIDVSGEVPYPEYVLRDPAAVASAILRNAELNGAAADDPADRSRPDGRLSS